MMEVRLAVKHPSLRNLRVLVVGVGRSGMAAARLAAAHGAAVRVADRRPRAELADVAAELQGLGIGLLPGGHPPELADDVDLIVLSPGVRSDVPVAVAARERGVPVWAEIELAYRYCDGRLIGITGSNGKSTTTSMVGTILRQGGIRGGTGGNLGTPLSDMLELDGPDAVHAIELSSFQLETIDAFRTPIAVLLNLTPDHLDRYASVEEYAAAKARLLQTQEPDDHAVINGDDPACRRFEKSIRGRAYRFSLRGRVYQGAYLEQGRLMLRTDFGEETIMDAGDLPLPGEHNVENALAAALCCRLSGCPLEVIDRGLRSFRPLPHRLERVAEIGGVTFFNDSKATNLDSAARAVRAFPRGKVLVILGGRDKGADWSAFVDVVLGRVTAALLVGEAAEAIAEAFGDLVPTIDCGDVSEAVRRAAQLARPGDVVVLAPGCASFDQYRSFEERGADFRRAVLQLTGEDDDA